MTCRGEALRAGFFPPAPRSAPRWPLVAQEARSQARTLHLELKVPAPAAMPKINGTLIRAGGSGRRGLLRALASEAVPGWEPLVVPSLNRAQHQFPAALGCSAPVTKALLPPWALALLGLVLCLLSKALLQDSQDMDWLQQTPCCGSTMPRGCTSSISWCGAPAQPTACTRRRAWAHGHLSPTLFVAHLGSPEGAICLPRGGICA